MPAFLPHHLWRLLTLINSGQIYTNSKGLDMKGAFCGMQNAESCQGVICGKFDADFFCGMEGKVQNESMRNVTEMNKLSLCISI